MVSTGQGLLGNNMFAYCANNPVLYVDHTGMLLGIPTLGDWRRIHKGVQYDIAEAEGYATEVYVSGPNGYGYLDIYDASTNQYYEVKSALQTNTNRTKKQMDKYDVAQVLDFRFWDYSIPNPPARGTEFISGSFTYKEWIVRYFSNGDGLITYTLEVRDEVAAVQAAVAIASTLPSAKSSFAGAGGFNKGVFANHDLRYV